jgi:uncharacterized protein involved in exopolysaccharide biosynthesis
MMPRQSPAKPKMLSRQIVALRNFLNSMLLKQRDAATRVRRYMRTAGAMLAAIWIAVAGYSLLPKTYTSEMTLILPAARSTSVFSLEAIGQANTQSDSPFSSITTTPKIIYQSIALSDEVLGTVAKQLEMKLTEFPKPRIDLIDETSLMIFKVYGNTANQAQTRAHVVLDVFLGKLDELRKDETDRRTESVKEGLTDVETSLKKARADILKFQQESDIVSDDQIKTLANQVEVLRSKVDEVEADGQRVDGERHRLGEILDVTPAEAAIALRFQDDPRYGALLKERTDALTLLSTNLEKWGANNPSAAAAKSHFLSADEAVRRLAATDLSDAASITLDKILTTSKDRSELFRKLVELDSEASGAKRNLTALREALTRQQEQLERRSANAARLADLERNHKIAEAVFGSALARVDSGREDIFGSYPLVQVMSQPTLPEKPTSPKPLIAAAGGGGATLLIALAVWLAWIRQPFLKRHLAT